ncbi:MAG TPA: outer membrane beta-barrel protein [Nitrobacter sp.]|jgi:opacity protein-like surface antigen|nr:outer membrane beta-barrel protein [Nitrobacter sp.]
MRGLLLAAVILGAAQSAQAADMPDFPPLRGSLPDGLSTTRTVWQGFYVGGQAGMGESDMNFAGATNDVTAKLLANTVIENEMNVSDWPVMGKKSQRGTGYGGFVGYNSQWDDVVLGVEANYLHGNFGGSDSGSMSRFYSASDGYTHYVSYNANAAMAIQDMGTLRVRGGYVWGSFLPYIFGGVALGQANITRTASISDNQVNNTTGQTIPFTASMTDAQNAHLIYGYSAGLGVDVNLMAGLFLRAEWEYVRFTSSIDTDINTVRVGLGYKF